MRCHAYHLVSGLVFTLVAGAHGLRAVLGTPVEIGASPLPVAASWIALVVAGGLAVWAVRSRPAAPST